VLVAMDVRFEVADTQKQGQGINAHFGKLTEGLLRIGDRVNAHVDSQRRQAIVLNHSATHLLHAALRQVLGNHVVQKGSLVQPERLRFDFSHFEPMTPQQICQVEALVNRQIRANNEVITRMMSYDDAVEAGAMALFGEKYSDEVRVLSIGDFSTELCGGVHAKRAGDIGCLKIVAEAGIASGVRRVEAVSGESALEYIGETEKNLASIASLVKGSRESALSKVGLLVERSRKLEKELEQLKARLASSQGADLAAQAVDVNGVKVLAAKLEGGDPKALRDTVDQLKNKLGSAAVVLATVNGKKIALVAGVTQDQTKLIKAGELVNHVAVQIGGKGGGRPDMAQAGGDNPTALERALKSVEIWVRNKIV